MLEIVKSLFDRDASILDTTKLQCAIYGDSLSGEKEAILCDNGELSSSIEVFGSCDPISYDEFTKKVDYISAKLTSFFKCNDQRIIVSYFNDPDDTEYIEKTSKILDKNCDSLSLDIKDIHRSDLEKINNITRTDRLIFTVETGVKSVLSVDYDTAEKEKSLTVDNIFSSLGFSHKYNQRKKMQQNGQNPMHFNSELYKKHQDNVDSVFEILTAKNLRCDFLTCQETIRFMHSIFDRLAPLNWKVITTPQTEEEIEADIERQVKISELSESKTSFRRIGDGLQINNDDISDLLLPPLATQIVGDDIVIHNDGYMSLNGMYFKAMYVEIPQQKLETFNQLSSDLNNYPYLMSWHLDSNEKKISKAIARGSFIGLASVLKSQSCIDIKRSSDILSAYKKEGIKPMAMYRMSVMTWGKDLDICRKNADKIRTEFSKWGSSQVVKTEKANPVQSLMEVMPSMTVPEINRSIPCLIEEAFYQMPITRVKSHWNMGVNNFILAGDNTIYPVQLGVKQQGFPRSIFLGKTGFGKSFLKNSMLMNSLFKKDYHKLPILAMCTIGYDGELFANTLRSALPEGRQHLVVADKPKLTAEYAVNIFDLEYGARLPRAFHVGVVSGYLEQCFAEPNQARLPQDFSGIIRTVVDSAYQYYSSDSDTAKMYSTGSDCEVDAFLDRAGIFSDERRRKWTWWDAFEYFHDQDNYRLAYRCQMQAMPNIGDLIHVMSESQSISDDARSAILNGQPVFDRFKRRVVELQGEYPNLCVATKYNIESARVIIFDLESVCPKGSPKESAETPSDRTTALMYQLYFMFQTRKFFIHQSREDFLSDTTVPSKYHEYHFHQIESEKGIPKIFDVDEKHRASKAYNFNAELSRILREMRKYGAEFSGASQRVTDWDLEVYSQIGAVFIMQMDASTPEEKDIYRKMLGFTDADFKMADSHLNGLCSFGQPFLLLTKGVDGSRSSRSLVPLYHCASSNKLWAYSTDKGDHNFRSLLEKRLKDANVPNPIRVARMVLSHSFDKGTIKHVVSSELKINPHKSTELITTELLNYCLKKVLEEESYV